MIAPTMRAKFFYICVKVFYGSGFVAEGKL